jgi:hypothetical protein
MGIGRANLLPDMRTGSGSPGGRSHHYRTFYCTLCTAAPWSLQHMQQGKLITVLRVNTRNWTPTNYANPKHLSPLSSQGPDPINSTRFCQHQGPSPETPATENTLYRNNDSSIVAIIAKVLYNNLQTEPTNHRHAAHRTTPLFTNLSNAPTL